MNKLSIYKILAAIMALITLNVSLTSCNKKSDDPDEPQVQPSYSVAVKSFKLNPNAKVMANLDSVFFSIDLDRGIIFNADSLPKGTDIEKLVPVITFPSTVETAELIMEGGNLREGTVNYKTNPSDTIDFSGRVTLRLTADNGALSRDYTIRINVHKAVADSLMWDKMANSELPSRHENPARQKSVALGNQIYSLIEEKDGTFTLASTQDIASSVWNKKELSPAFRPDISTFSATEQALYILSDTGSLLTSSDGTVWNHTGIKWHNIIGGYGGKLLGILSQDGNYCHDIYPRPAGYTPVATASDFPVDGLSNLLTFKSKWTENPYAFFVGGLRGNIVTSATWSYDGSEWAKISNTPLPAMSDALIVPYFMYRKTSTSWIQTEYSVTLCLGGKKDNGNLSRDVYLSYDSGVHWSKAGQLMQLPDALPSFYGADGVIATTSMHASIDAWAAQTTPRPKGARIQYFVNGTDVEWDCPYIYLIGGYNDKGQLLPAIWRGVLARLTFAPLF
ncbi:MAG: hypothetical protein K2M03_06655 [Muribaculaceae bacterium]|nr:hypothetical protein [Muribaculaceae bacterium]